MGSSRKRLRYMKKRSRKHSRRQRGGQTGPKISFVSYGNDKFKNSRVRIYEEAKKMGFMGNIQIYTPDNLSKDFRDAIGDVLDEERGGGYMTWKPYVLIDMLNKMGTNDVLLYADAGCTLNPAGIPRLKQYAEMISPTTNKSVLAMRLVDGTTYGPGGFLEKKWTSMPIFDYFNEAIDGNIANSNQTLSGFVMCRKCPESMKVIGKWLEVATTRPDLFTDRHNEESKKFNPAFIENRHDQSIWSMIVQTAPYKDQCIIINEEIENINGTNQNLDDKPVHATKIRG